MSWVATLVRQNKLIFLWFFFLVLTTGMQIFITNPTMNPNSIGPFNFAQLQLQFAFTPENGVEVLRGWGGDASARYLRVIWIDYAFALSYGPFFYMVIKNLDGRPLWYSLPLVEVGTNFIETTLEIYWVLHQSDTNPMPTLFFIHSVFASIKWLVLVPIYITHFFILLARMWRERAQWMPKLQAG